MKLGLALSGGAVRGAAHVGALMALESAGLAPCAIAGTSVGALVGALAAAGHRAGDLAAAFAELGWGSLLGPSLRAPLSLFDAGPMERLLAERFGLTTFEALGVPFAAVACDIVSGSEVVLRGGDLVSAVRASTALPGIFPPVERCGELLVDGGLCNNLPIDVARALGADVVLAVDLLPPWRALGPPARLPDLWERALTLLVQGNQRHAQPADIVVQPAVAAFSFTDFADAGEMITLGRQATEQALSRAGLAGGGPRSAP